MPPRPAAPPQLQSAPEALRKFVESLLTLDVEEPWAQPTEVKETGAAPWRPPNAYTLVMGSLDVEGNVLVEAAGHDEGVLVVFGDVTCRNLFVGVGFTFVCTGTLRVKETLVATSMDSVTYAAGVVEAEVVDSGSGAWLTLFGDASQLHVKHLTYYVMNGRKVIKSQNPPDLRTLVVPEVLDLEEWDSLSAEEQADEDPKDIIKLDAGAARERLARGESLFLSP
ncbi:hypothetical protein D7V80_34730 [Corallococcus sp. CA054B]|uniref:hypothetical protein n=1 Tax=Corallococcus sp. CA054B TaxID=2316734 RepID=UPI000EA38822|nr:hypothetical protein [Corallococcus sp. CA054B]RKG61399.1 hypothetical protein D7V80_34730 [Corallococcus sp. CA054B]